jgi:CheY-like chemotaxis protein
MLIHNAMKILVVDDEKMTLLAMAKRLEDENHKVITSTSGVEALKIIADEKIDLIISDVMMPCISGFTLLSMLKNFYFSKVPLILMSGYPVDKQVLINHGLHDYDFISKPINYDELNDKINRAVSV